MAARTRANEPKPAQPAGPRQAPHQQGDPEGFRRTRFDDPRIDAGLDKIYDSAAGQALMALSVGVTRHVMNPITDRALGLLGEPRKS